MANPIISWDDMDGTPTPFPPRDYEAEARESLKSLDLSEANRELDEQAKAIEQRKAVALEGGAVVVPKPKRMISENNSAVKQVTIETVEDIGIADSVLAERVLESLSSARSAFDRGEAPKVDDKRLINSTSDINQLVPFKYSWAWSMYLDSTEKHWMPAECILENDAQSYADLKKSHRKLLQRFLTNVYCLDKVFGGEQLINLFRLSTNPECRQYLLREGFEESVVRHTLIEWAAMFNLDPYGKDTGDEYTTDAIGLDFPTLDSRDILLRNNLSMLNTTLSTTTTNDDIVEFVKCLCTVYCGVKRLAVLVPIYQLWKFHQQTNNLSGVAKNLFYITRDLVRQYEYGVRVIKGILEENELHTPTVITPVTQILEAINNSNLDLLSTLSVDSNDYRECGFISNQLTYEFLRDIGVSVDAPKINPEGMEFINYLNSLNGKHDGNVTLSSTDATKGSLQW
jgi:Ribonucleotide reductase, beta subunit